MALREILVALGIEIDKASQKRVNDAMRNVENRMSSLKKVALSVGGIFLTGKIARGFANTINEAGDAAETLNRFQAVFKENTDNMIESLDGLSKRTGQGRIALQELAADAGSLLRPLVDTTKATTELSKTIVGAALDLSSLENVRAKDALLSIKSAIVGSSEPILRYGIDTRQAALQQFALSKGISQSVEKMDRASITALRMELIMARLGTKGAIGDAEKTAMSYTNRVRALTTGFKDWQAEVGKEFIPIAKEVLTILIDFVRNTKEAIKYAKNFAIFLRSISNVTRGLISPFKQLNTILMFLGSTVLLGLAISFKSIGAFATAAAIRAAAAWLAVAIPLIALGALIYLIIDDLFALGDGQESMLGTMITGIQNLIDKYGDLGTAIGDMLDAAIRHWLKYFGKTDQEAQDWIDNLTETFKNFWPNILNFWKNKFQDFLSYIADGFSGISEFFTGKKIDKKTGKLMGSQGKTGSAISVPKTMTPTGGGIGSYFNQPNTDITVNIEGTSLQGTPESIGNTTAKKVQDVQENMYRQQMQSFASGG